MSAEAERSDEQFREWMRHNLARAAEHFETTVVDQPIFGWRLRSMSAHVRGRDGDRWLRVVSERPHWLPGEFWTGNQDANVIAGLAKPHVIDTTEWDDSGWRKVRAELMTLMSGSPCSPTDVLRELVELPDSWWAELRRTIDALRVTPTTRTSADDEKLTRQARTVFGQSTVTPIQRWETVHGDLHWSNLLQPRFGLLDWEWWGRGPAGTDAATLYCHSLLMPTVARHVHDVFADLLDTPTGHTAQIYAAARLLSRADTDYPDLTEPLHRHIHTLIRSTT